MVEREVAALPLLLLLLLLLAEGSAVRGKQERSQE